MRSRRGLTILETVIAVFVLTAAVLVVTALFPAGLRHLRKAEAAHMAACIAENRLEQVRAWSNTPQGSGYGFDDFSAYDGMAASDPDHPEYQVAVHAIDQSLYSPSSQFEETAVGPKREFTGTFKKVQVTVRWEGESLTTVTYLADPTRRLRTATPVEIVPTSPIPNPLPQGDSVTFEANGYDQDGRRIPDLRFRWYIVPITGNGTIDPSRDGLSAVFTNSVTIGSTVKYTGGACQVAARATYRGETRSAVSEVIQLQ